MKKKKVTKADIGEVSHYKLTDQDLRNQSQGVLDTLLIQNQYKSLDRLDLVESKCRPIYVIIYL